MTTRSPQENLFATTLGPRWLQKAPRRKCLQRLWAQVASGASQKEMSATAVGPKMTPRGPQPDMSATILGPRWPQEALKVICLRSRWALDDHKRPPREPVCNHFGPKRAPRSPAEKMSATTLGQGGFRTPFLLFPDQGRSKIDESITENAPYLNNRAYFELQLHSFEQGLSKIDESITENAPCINNRGHLPHGIAIFAVSRTGALQN